MADPTASTERIGSYLGLPLDPEKLRQIVEQTSFECLKRLSRQIETLETPRLVRKDGYIFDRETLLHQNHIRNGGVGYGARVLNRRQRSGIDEMLREEGFEFLCEPHSWEVPRLGADGLPVDVRGSVFTT